MPRIRRLKHYDNKYAEAIAEELHLRDDYTEIIEETTSDDSGEDEGISERSSSWLSTENIIYNTPDKKLREAIHYYRSLTKRLQDELDARNSGLKFHITSGSNDIVRFAVGSLYADRPEFRVRTRSKKIRQNTNVRGIRSKRNGLKQFIKKLKLSPKEQGELLRMWENILNGE